MLKQIVKRLVIFNFMLAGGTLGALPMFAIIYIAMCVLAILQFCILGIETNGLELGALLSLIHLGLLSLIEKYM